MNMEKKDIFQDIQNIRSSNPVIVLGSGPEAFCPGAQLGSLPGALSARPEQTWKYEAAYTQEVFKTTGAKSPRKNNPVFLPLCGKILRCM